MKFMMLMIPGVYQDLDGNTLDDFAPPAEMVAEMMRYNEELAKAGVLLALEGLQPLDRGARVTYKGGAPAVTDGPFIEAKEVLGGFWLIDVASKEEAVEWARKVPAQPDDTVEVRQVFDVTEDWPEDARKAADSPIVREALEARSK